MRPKLTAFIFSSPYLWINNNKTMKYIKKFDRHADYEAYINGGGAVLPNVSYCVDRNEVHFNPYDPYNGHEYIDLGLPSGKKRSTSADVLEKLIMACISNGEIRKGIP